MPKTKTFRVSDETVTCYGVRILSNGLQIDAFLANPVMLYMHVRGRVIGKWLNLRSEKNEWLAEPEFDNEVELGDQIGGQVERGFINAASITAEILEVVWNETLQCYDATKAILQEISIVDIGGNRNALRLCDSRGDVLTEDQAKGYLLQLSNQSKPFTNPNEQMNLVAIALACRLLETATQEQITAKVLELKAAATGDGFKEKYEALIKKQKEDQTANAIKLVDSAITEKRVNADQKDTYIQLFATDFALAEKVLASIQKPVDLVQLANNGVNTIQNIAQSSEADLIKLYDEMDRSGKLEPLMKSDRAKFDAIYKAKWGKTYSGK
jgi:hypothetical protein